MVKCSKAEVRRLRTALRWKIPAAQRQRMQMVLLRESGMTQPAIAAAIVTLLRQIEVSMAQDKSAAEACREAGISLQSYYRWRKEYGGLENDQAKRMKDLERENVRLKRLVADLSLEKQVLKDVASGNLFSIRGA
jgi:putative transposase